MRRSTFSVAVFVVCILACVYLVWDSVNKTRELNQENACQVALEANYWDSMAGKHPFFDDANLGPCKGLDSPTLKRLQYQAWAVVLARHQNQERGGS